jgi:hypothetical protein
MIKEKYAEKTYHLRGVFAGLFTALAGLLNELAC